MSRLKLAEVCDILRHHTHIDTFTCLAMPYGRARNCKLGHDQILAAKTTLRNPWWELTYRDIRDVICCLVCEVHQETYTYKHKIQAQWAEENELRHIKEQLRERDGSRSPHSLSGRKAQHSRSASSTRSPERSRRENDYFSRPSFAARTSAGSLFGPPTNTLPEFGPGPVIFGSASQHPRAFSFSFEPARSSVSSSTGQRVDVPQASTPSSIFGQTSPLTPSILIVDEDGTRALNDDGPESPAEARSCRMRGRLHSRPRDGARDGPQSFTQDNDVPTPPDCLHPVPSDAVQSTAVTDARETLTGDSDSRTQDHPYGDDEPVLSNGITQGSREDNDTDMIDDSDDGEERTVPDHVTNQAEPKSPTPPPRDDRFSPGEASKWSPGTINSDVLDVFFDPLPRADEKGLIYAMKVNTDGPVPIVKIGITTRTVKQRAKEIAEQRKCSLDLREKYMLSGIPILELKRLEALVHAALAFHQRDLKDAHGGRFKTHDEYFEVDIDAAKQTIDFWYKAMRDVGLKPGRKIDEKIISEIRGSPALAADVSLTAATNDGGEIWRLVNSDHVRRDKLWREVFKTDSGGFEQSRTNGVYTRIGIVFSLLLLPGLLGNTASLGYILFVFAVPFVEYWWLWYLDDV
jgi:hypothetical protein